MNEKEINTNDDLLDKKKKILNNKEEQIMKSQIIQNKLEDKIKNLEIKKEKIIKSNKWLLGNIIYTTIYDFIMAVVLILFILNFTNIVNLIIPLNYTIYVVGLILGVLSISVIGAYISAKIGDKLKCYYKQKRVLKTSKCIKENEKLLANEINKQESLKKEITNIMNEFDNGLENNIKGLKNDYIYYRDKNILDIFDEIKEKPFIRVKIRDDMNNRN